MTRGEKVIAFIHKYCKVPEGKLIRQPIQLDQFQKDFILAVYDNKHITRQAILSIARKNGKSAIIACLLLAHLAGPEVIENSQIVSGAMSRDQAALVFKLATKMIGFSPDLAKAIRILPSAKSFIGLNYNVEYRALSAEAATTHGLSPVLIILDETGQVKGPQSDFIDALTTSQGAHDNPLLICISTQAATDADLLSIWIDDALKGEDPQSICHLYTTPKDADLQDRASWKLSNPALGIFRSEEDVAQQAEQALRMPSKENTFRNLTLNQRVSVNSPFISLEVWKANAAAPLQFDKGTQVFGGLDLSMRTDLTALVLIGRIAGIWQAHTYVWTPEDGLAERAHKDRCDYVLWATQGYLLTTPGKTVDYEYVARDIAEITSGLNMHSIAFDRWHMPILRKEFADIGIDTELPAKEGGKLPLVDFGQGYQSISPAMGVLEEFLLNSQVAHGMHPLLTMAAANGVVMMDPAGNRKLNKQKATGRIDPLIAMVMAFGAVNLAAADLEPERDFQIY
jgi:phage terminase large subunit-like protein